ncbi:putative DNA-J protein [Trypanosoma grayi]|uniref:putative DNA-J protein n=1 Tax=Trypanosoma grayi TaxID=71804 RepID=UPI0004F4249E|nr:putative DNA-J protein [Trypanosoma grayi]KEG14834.1 putative DNA-J protein [Trypanosoma grayi]
MRIALRQSAYSKTEFYQLMQGRPRPHCHQLRLLLFTLLAIVIIAPGSGVSSSTPDDDGTKKLLLLGDAELRQGRSHYQEALAKYTEALAHNPNSIRGLYSRAELLSMMRQREACMQDLDRLLQLDGKHHRGLALRSSLHAQGGHLQESIRDVESLISVYKTMKKSSKVAEYEGKLQKLRDYASTWLPLRKKLDAARHSSGTVTHSEYETCVVVLHDMIREFAKDNVELRLQRAECALACGDNLAASEELKYVVQKEPQNLGAVALGARAFRALGALDQARAELRRCLSLDPEYAACAHLHKLVREQIRVTSGVTKALEAKEFQNALKQIDAAEKLEEDPPYKDQLLRWRCDAAVGLRDTETGLRVCDTVMQRLGEENPAAFDVHLQKVELYLMEDDLNRAEEQLRHAQRLQPNHAHVREYMQKIENLKRAGARKDYYKILGVKKTASATEIRRAYRHLAKTLHPDKLRSQKLSQKERQKADERFRDINEAKEILLDDEKRGRYDSGEDPTKPAGQQGGGHPFYGHPFTFHGDPFGQGNPFGQGGGHQQFFFRFG